MWNFILLVHPTTGMLAILCAVWLLTETYSPGPHNIGRMHLAARLVALLMAMTWVAGGTFYVLHYPVEKAIILQGPWPWAHDFFMETKEHLFFIPLILSLYLPFAITGDLLTSNGARAVARTTTVLIILSGLAVEGAGAMVGTGVKAGLMNQAAAAATRGE